MSDYVDTNGEVCEFQDKLLFADELACALGRSRVFVYAMVSEGFEMPAGLATHVEAALWLMENSGFSAANYIKGGKV